MHVEGRIETTNFKKYFVSMLLVGLDMADEHRLLDQRITFETNFQVASTATRLNCRVKFDKAPSKSASYPTA
jgi:hypothetical protein